MKGDFTRFTYDSKKHYTSVRMQQGRLQLDSDWNELTDIQNHLRQAQVVDMIGAGSGAPSVNPDTGKATRNSFRIGLVSLRKPPQDSSNTDAQDRGSIGSEINNDLVIIPGHFYANGVLCELELGAPFNFQVKSNQNEQVVISVNSLSVDGRKLEPGQWLELVMEDGLDSETVANSTATDLIHLSGFLIEGVDEKRRELTLKGFLETEASPKLRRLITYRTQPDYPIPAEQKQLVDGDYLAYLDVWEQHVTVNEDEEIRETALNVPDTTTRTKTVWQLKLFSEPQEATEVFSPEAPKSLMAAWDNYLKNQKDRTAQMNACARLCGNGQGGVTSLTLDNQLYRVEIHQAGTVGNAAVVAGQAQSAAIATFKWSRNNGSTASVIDRIDPNGVIRIRKTSEDAWATSIPGQWLEILSRADELQGKPGVLVPLKSASDTQIQVDESRIIQGPIPTDAYLIRRWDYTTNQAPQGAIPVQTEWVELEAGIKVQFDDQSTYQTGDYWLIPARSGPGDIEWPNDQAKPVPQPVAQSRRGPYRQYAALATVQLRSQQFTENLSDTPRLVFPPLINCLDRSGGLIEGDLEVQGDLSITERPDPDDAQKKIVGNLGVGIKKAAARLHIKAADGVDLPLVQVDGGQEKRFTVLSNGQVQIGTGTAASQLTVNGTTRTTTLEVTGSFSANEFKGQSFSLVKNPTTAPELYGAIAVREDATSKRIEFTIAAASTFTFASGKVGIGATTLTSQFGVVGNAAIGDSAYLNSGGIPANGLVVKNTVGIGTPTPNPQFKLDVVGGVQATGSVVLATTATDKVLIGATTSPDPADKLYIKGNVQIDGNIEATNLTFQSNIIASRGNSSLRFRTNGNDRMVINSDGNVGIGQDPAGSKVSITGDLRTIGVIRGNRFIATNGTISSAENVNLTLSTGNDERIVISENTGNVGIGADPIQTARVLVNGNLQVNNGVIQGDRVSISAETGTAWFGLPPSADPPEEARLIVHDGLLRISRTVSGTERFVQIGRDANPALRFCNYQTNCPRNYFDKPITVDGDLSTPQLNSPELNSPANQDLVLKANGAVGITITEENGTVIVGEGSVPNQASNAKLYVNGRVFGREVNGSSIVQLSSQTLKQDITDLSSAEVAELLEQLQPVKFRYRDDETADIRAGFLAEETPDLLTSADGNAIKILDVVAVLTRSLKDQHTIMTDLSAVVQQQRQEITRLQSQMQRLERQQATHVLPLENLSLEEPTSVSEASRLGEWSGGRSPEPMPDTIPQPAFQSLLSSDLSPANRRSRSRRRSGWNQWPLIRQLQKLFNWLFQRKTKRRLQ